jgi:hypothetical protein
VNGQTAWSLMKKTERFDIQVVTDLDVETTDQMNLTRIAVDQIEIAGMKGHSGYLIPLGSKIKISCD